MTDLDVYLHGIAAGEEEAFAAWLAGGERRVRLSLRSVAPHVDTEAVLQARSGGFLRFSKRADVCSFCALWVSRSWAGLGWL
jgi:hypothetical protein